MQPSSAPLRRLFTHFAPSTSAIALPDTSRRVMDGLAAISPRHPRGDRLHSLACLGREHLEDLSADWRHLDAQWHQACPAEQRANLARQRAAVRNLHTVLTAGALLLEDFEAGQVVDETPALREAVAQRLRQESRETCSRPPATGTPARALAYASLVAPRHRIALLGDLFRDAASRGRIQALCARPEHRFLDEAALLMVRHYAHPHHRTFNVLRAVHELDQSHPELGAGAQFADITGLFAQGIGGAFRLPALRVGAPLFKGAPADAAWDLRTGLAFCLERPLSTSRGREYSYVGRQPPGRPPYDHLFTYGDGVLASQKVDAVDITAFHPVSTRHQREAMVLPGQAFQVTGQSSGEVPGDHGPMPAQFIELQKLGRSADWERFARYYGLAPSA